MLLENFTHLFLRNMVNAVGCYTNVSHGSALLLPSHAVHLELRCNVTNRHAKKLGDMVHLASEKIERTVTTYIVWLAYSIRSQFFFFRYIRLQSY